MSGYLYFFICLAFLIAGYAVYGVIAEKVFGVDRSRPTPVMTRDDGVDYVKMPLWKMIVIQLLNIAGLGPVFGPIIGALYGPSALLWVVFGCVLGGAVHDYMSGMISLRYGGAGYHEVLGRNLGHGVRTFMEFFTVIFLILVGAVFVAGPANLLLSIFPAVPYWVWAVLIFAYYICATIFPIDKVIGKIYPFFAVLLIFMAIGLTIALFAEGYDVLPNVSLDTLFTSQHPKGGAIWPALFVIIACGAISGFHATQSPMMAKCMTNESQGRKVFYGSMIMEGVIALIWVTIGLSFYKSPAELEAAGPAPVVVKNISFALLGTVGGILAVLGVVVLPVSTGDTAFRGARVTLAEILKMDQTSIKSRLLLSVPLFVVGAVLCLVDFSVIWRYFGWANQTLSCVCLWAISVYLYRRGRFHWMTTLPAMFMTVMVVTFICQAKIGLNLPISIATWVGVIAMVIAFVCFMIFGKKMPESEKDVDSNGWNTNPPKKAVESDGAAPEMAKAGQTVQAM